MKNHILIMVIAVIVSTFGQATPPLLPPTGGVVQGNNAFAMDLYAKLAAKQKGNLFFSPGSIHTALAMTYAGAEGNTAKQMAGTLHFNQPAAQIAEAYGELISTLSTPGKAPILVERKIKEIPAYELTIANALWGQNGYEFKKPFIQQLQKDYKAGLNEVDFAQTEVARKMINDWAAKQTKDRIKNLVPQGQLDPLTRLVLANAIYFKSQWAEMFHKSETRDDEFKLDGEKTITVAMMHQVKSLHYMESDDLQLLELPYLRHELSMFILLPRKIDGLAAVEKQLTAGNIETWLGKRMTATVNVTLPKFQFTGQFLLAGTLKQMGIADAFDETRADFSGMTSGKKLFISEVIHKTFVAVDEEGTEAAGATAVLVAASNGMGGHRAEPVTFTADHPFIFLIRHNNSGDILFIGRVMNPKGE